MVTVRRFSFTDGNITEHLRQALDGVRLGHLVVHGPEGDGVGVG